MKMTTHTTDDFSIGQVTFQDAGDSMDRKAQNIRPLARKEDLLVKELPGEVLIYDLARDRAHCLNETAAFVWKRCDGRNTPRDIASSLGKKVNSKIDEKIIWLAIDQLADNDLLKRRPAAPPSLAGMNRRQAVRTLGLTAVVVAVPLVTSIVAPTAAQAATCLPAGSGCGSSPQCCSGLCNAGTCA